MGCPLGSISQQRQHKKNGHARDGQPVVVVAVVAVVVVSDAY